MNEYIRKRYTKQLHVNEAQSPIQLVALFEEFAYFCFKLSFRVDFQRSKVDRFWFGFRLLLSCGCFRFFGTRIRCLTCPLRISRHRSIGRWFLVFPSVSLVAVYVSPQLIYSSIAQPQEIFSNHCGIDWTMRMRTAPTI